MKWSDSIVVWSVVIAAMTLPAEEIHPDWKAKVDAAIQSGLLSIPANEVWIANQDDMTNHIDRLSERKLLVRGTLVLDDVVTWFKTTNVFYPDDVYANYPSRIVKRGSGVLRQNRHQYNFRGTFVVAEGEFQIANDYPLCANQPSCNLIVEDGATLRFAAADGTTPRLGMTRLHASGTGVDGIGAVIVDKASTGAIAHLVLSNDTTVVLNTTTRVFDSYTNPGSGAYGTVETAQIEFNGHKLTIGGTAATVSLGDTVTSGSGTIDFLPLESGERKLNLAAATTDMSGVGEIVFKGDSVLQFSAACPAPASVLTAEGNLTVMQSSTPVTSVLDGGIQLAQGKTLTVVPYSETRTVVLNGVVSGSAAVQVGASGAPASGFVVFAGESDFAAGLSVYGNGALDVYLGYPLPDWNRLNVDGAVVRVRAGNDSDGQPRWTGADVVGLAARQELFEITVDVSELTDGTEFEIGVSDVKGNDFYKTVPPVWGAFGSAGRYSLSGPYTGDYPLNIILYEGSIRLTGQEEIVLGSAVVSGTSAEKSGTLVLDGANVVFADQKIDVGSLDQNLWTPVARVIVTNSTLASTTHAASYSGAGAMNLGKYSTGILEVEAGSVVSNRIYVGGGVGTAAEGYAGGVGAVFQRGGTVVPFGTGDKNYCSTVGFFNKAFGYYELSGGLLRTRGSFNVGCYSSGLFVQLGGTAVFKGLGISVLNGGVGHYCVREGRTFVSNILSLATGNANLSIVTVHGKNALFSVYDNSTRGIIYAAVNKDGGKSIFNLNDGGVLQASAINVGVESYADTIPYPVVVNFNGGIVKATDFDWDVFGGGSGGHGRLSKVAVYEKGAAVDTNGRNFDTYSALVGAGDGGIASITLAAPVSCKVAPDVFISGDGYGATAIAEFDSRSSLVTNILITSRGWGYTKESTTVRLQYNSGNIVKSFAKEDFEVAANDVGGFTKLGAGTLTLSVARTNTWEKWTRIAGGTLKAGSEKSIPDGTELQLDGGTLDLNGTTVKFTSVSGTGGAVVNGNVLVNGTRTVDVAELCGGDRSVPIYNADIVFEDGAKIVFTNTELLDADTVRKCVLFKVGAENAISGAPAVEGLPKGWTFRLTAAGVRITRDRGFAVIVR